MSLGLSVLVDPAYLLASVGRKRLPASANGTSSLSSPALADAGIVEGRQKLHLRALGSIRLALHWLHTGGHRSYSYSSKRSPALVSTLWNLFIHSGMERPNEAEKSWQVFPMW